MEVDKGKKISPTTEIGRLFAIIIESSRSIPDSEIRRTSCLRPRRPLGQLDKFMAKKRYIFAMWDMLI
jgi:hypothetical protein